MSAFFDAFWPNLASTLIGILVGIPIALLINRRLVEHQRKFEMIQKAQQLDDAIEVLIAACHYNIKVLDSIREDSLAGRALHSPDLRLTTWDAVGSILSNNCSSPELLQVLSHHWLRLHRIQALCEDVFTREVSGGFETMEPELVKQFWQTLHDNSYLLAEHASVAIKQLKEFRAPDNEFPP